MVECIECGSMFPDHDEGPWNRYMFNCAECYAKFQSISKENDSKSGERPAEVEKSFRVIFKGDPGLLRKMTNATYMLKWDDENSVDIVMSDEEYVEDHLPYFQYLRCAEMGCPEVVALSLCDQGKHWTCQQHRCCQDVELFPDIISSTSAFRTPDQRTTAGMLSELSDASLSVLSPPTLCDMDSDNCGGSCNSSDATLRNT